jgi:hypothetical protein
VQRHAGAQAFRPGTSIAFFLLCCSKNTEHAFTQVTFFFLLPFVSLPKSHPQPGKFVAAEKRTGIQKSSNINFADSLTCAVSDFDWIGYGSAYVIILDQRERVRDSESTLATSPLASVPPTQKKDHLSVV